MSRDTIVNPSSRRPAEIQNDNMVNALLGTKFKGETAMSLENGL